MCLYITGVLPRGVDRVAIEPILIEHRLAFSPLGNQFVQAQLRPDESYVRATSSFCDCATPIGSGPRGPSESQEAAHDARRVEELRKKGWGAAKIERWLDQQARTRRRDVRVRRVRDADEATTLDRWRLGIEALSLQAKRVGLLLHWYQGGLDSERIRIARREEVPIAALTVERLRGIDEDVLYLFFAAR